MSSIFRLVVFYHLCFSSIFHLSSLNSQDVENLDSVLPLANCAHILVSVQVTTKPILIYPNSGESYDADRKEWVVSSFSIEQQLVFGK